jgi:hypothetical protein
MTDSGSRKTVRLLNSEWIDSRHDGRVTQNNRVLHLPAHTTHRVHISCNKIAKLEGCYFKATFFQDYLKRNLETCLPPSNTKHDPHRPNTNNGRNASCLSDSQEVWPTFCCRWTSLSHLLCLDLSSAGLRDHMSVQISAFISLCLATAAFVDYLTNDNCGIEEELPTGKSFFCSAAFNATNPDKPGAFICCEPNEFISFSSVPLIGAWFIAFAIAFLEALSTLTTGTSEPLKLGKERLRLNCQRRKQPPIKLDVATRGAT